MLKPVLAVMAFALATPGFAADPAKGEASFKKCKSCHSIIAPDAKSGTAMMSSLS